MEKPGMVTVEPVTLCKNCSGRKDLVLCGGEKVLEKHNKVLWNVITGARHEGLLLCTDVNTGNCPYFEQK